MECGQVVDYLTINYDDPPDEVVSKVNKALLSTGLRFVESHDGSSGSVYYVLVKVKE